MHPNFSRNAGLNHGSVVGQLHLEVGVGEAFQYSSLNLNAVLFTQRFSSLIAGLFPIAKGEDLVTILGDYDRILIMAR